DIDLRRHDKPVPLQRAIDFGEIRGLIARRLQHHVARNRARDVGRGTFEACEPIGRALRRGGSDRTAKAVGSELDGGGCAGDALLPAFTDARLAREQRGDVLIAHLAGHQSEDTQRKTEGRETYAPRLLTLDWY